jgi:hypothetical protein
MCRSGSEGGRRCPHDSSAARHARRIQKSLSGYNSTAPAAASPNLSTYPSALQGKTVVDDFIQNVKQQIEAKQFPLISEDGKEFHNVNEFMKHSGVLLEVKISRLGGTIINEVEKATGVTFQSIVEEYKKTVMDLTLKTDQLIQEEDLLLSEAGEYFGDKNPSRLIFDRIRLEHNSNPEEETIRHLKEKLDSIIESKKHLTDNLNTVERHYPASVREKYLHNINSLMDVLTTLRSFGGNVKVNSKSEKNKTETIQYASQFYPTEWIEQSNYNPVDLIVKKTIGRAHYTHWTKTAKVSPLFKLMYYDVEPEDMEDAIILAADENGVLEYENEEINVRISTYGAPNEKFYLMPQWEYPNPWTTNYNSDGSPKGYGWKPYLHPSTGKTAWRRIIRQRETSIDKTSANILVDENINNLNNIRGFDSAIHELAHRMEAVEVPFLKQVQKAFYTRRTTLPNGEQQKPTRLYKGRKEYSITDSFSSDYMGKQYSGETHFELLSTGMEAIFGGEYAGGLIGLKNKNPDEDMRNFIVGTLASL